MPRYTSALDAPGDGDGDGDGDEDYVIPFRDQRIFGAGLKRKRVSFVPPRSPNDDPSTTSSGAPLTPGHVGDYYLSVVLPKASPPVDERKPPAREPTSAATPVPRPASPTVRRCVTCDFPLDPSSAVTADATGTSGSASSSTPHEASFVHQVCLPHSHPPSHLDRRRKGFRYLSSYGWDPDSRRGLGAGGDGIRDPITAKVKANRLGVGCGGPREGASVPAPTRKKLGAKEMQLRHERERRETARLRDAFYGTGDVEKYLGYDT
ncbi:MAG: hypothetical protein M1833_003436 [Piccolia ochrophora]|nr:MAG: hypothetical protein M1833_003436 [Piccolia ochrophora]